MTDKLVFDMAQNGVQTLDENGNAVPVTLIIPDGAFAVDASPFIQDIVTSDTTTYDPPLLGLRVGTTAGDIKVVSNGVDSTAYSVQIGETVVGNITKVYATGTAAVGINGWHR